MFGQNQQSSQGKPTFQDTKIRLYCFGHCGSKMMNLFANDSNLSIFKSENLPRLIDVTEGRNIPKAFYEKLLFDSKETEEEFMKIFLDEIQETAHASMGFQ